MVKIISDRLISTCNNFVGLCEEPLPEVYMAGAVFARVFGDMHTVWKLIGLKLPICQGASNTHTTTHKAGDPQTEICETTCLQTTGPCGVEYIQGNHS